MIIDLEAIENQILDYLNDISLYDRFCYQIVISSRVSSLLSDAQYKAFNEFSYLETGKYIHITPYLNYDICVVNNKVRPIKNLKTIDIEGKSQSREPF